jgi:hypothetical protein
VLGGIATYAALLWVLCLRRFGETLHRPGVGDPAVPKGSVREVFASPSSGLGHAGGHHLQRHLRLPAAVADGRADVAVGHGAGAYRFLLAAAPVGSTTSKETLT